MTKKPVLAILTLAVVVAVAGCVGSAPPTAEPVDPALALLREHGWEPAGTLGSETVTIGDPDVVPEHVWQLYLESSRGVGLDFAPLWGRPAQLARVDLGGPRASLLAVDGAIVGAWLYGGEGSACVPGVFSLSTPRVEIESCG